MKNISLKVWAPVVLVIVAAGGIISWYYWPDGTKVSTDSIIKEPWQTYRNEKYGFELMYPDGFVLNTETVRPVHGTNDMIGSSFPDIEGKIVAQSGAQIESSAPPVIGFDIFPSVTVFEGNAKSLEEYTRQLADYRDLPFGEIFINNIPAYKITYGRQTEEVYFEVYFQNAAADVIRFWYTDIFCLQYKETVCTKKAENNLANQVLSTFRFIDNSNPQVERNKPITN